MTKNLEELGLHPRLRSECEMRADSEESVDSETEEPLCLVVNTTGELRAWYHLASVVVIGKSFLGKGGQNPVEAIMAEKPVITGPHMENFKAVMDQLLETNGVVQVSGEDKLMEAITGVLEDPEKTGLMVERGRAAIDRHRGAAKRAVEMICQ